MDVLGWILVAIRWVHALAAVAWVGGSIFYIMVLRPSRRRMQLEAPESGAAIGAEFRSLVNTAIGVLLLTGVILSLSRLTADTVTAPYVGVLAAKIILALYMFYVVRFLRPSIYTEEKDQGRGWWDRVRRSLTNTTAVLITGVVVIGLSDVLDALFEQALGT